jgi:hypothetical protein
MMGADLYIESNYDALQARLQPEFEAAVRRRDTAKSTKARDEAQEEIARIYDTMHPPTAYFRDAYNSHCLLAQLGLSWWHDIAPRLTEDDHLPLSDVRWLVDEVRNRRLTCQLKATYEQQVTSEVMAKVAGGIAPVPVTDSYTAQDVQWLVFKKAALLEFLSEALRLAEPPVCSL